MLIVQRDVTGRLDAAHDVANAIRYDHFSIRHSTKSRANARTSECECECGTPQPTRTVQPRTSESLPYRRAEKTRTHSSAARSNWLTNVRTSTSTSTRTNAFAVWARAEYASHPLASTGTGTGTGTGPAVLGHDERRDHRISTIDYRPTTDIDCGSGSGGDRRNDIRATITRYDEEEKRDRRLHVRRARIVWLRARERVSKSFAINNDVTGRDGTGRDANRTDASDLRVRAGGRPPNRRIFAITSIRTTNSRHTLRSDSAVISARTVG